MFRKNYSSYDQTSRGAIHRFFVMVIDNKPSLLELHYSILNKFALLYVRAVQNDFPYIWQDAFSILIERAPRRDSYMKLLFTVLKLFNEEFAEELGYLTQEQLRRSNELKDAMRESVLSPAATLWLQTLQSENLQLIAATFQVISPYIDWIPIEITFTFIPFMIKYVSNEQCQIPAINCLESVVAKRMDPKKKLEIIDQIGLIPFLQGINLDSFDMLSDVPKAVSSLIDTLGSNLIDAEVLGHIQIVLEMALKCLDSADTNISKIVIGFISKYIHYLKSKEYQQPPVLLTDQEKNNISLICMTLIKRCQFPSDFEHVGPDNSDEEDQFYKYRKELADLFKKLLQVESTKEPVVDYLISSFNDILGNIQNFTVEQLEVPLFLFFHLGESLTELSTLLTTDTKYSFLMRAILQSNLKASNHKIILRQYFEIGVRYGTFFSRNEHKQLIENLLEPMIRNMSNQDVDVSKHAIYMFSRLALKIPAAIVPYSRPVLEVILNRIKQGNIDGESEKNLYKAIGLIIGCRSNDLATQESCLESVLNLLGQQITPNALLYIGEVLSGFGRKVPVEVQIKISQLAQRVVGSMLSTQLSPELHKSLVYFSQKLVETMEDDSSPYIKELISYLISNSTLDNIESVFNLITQVCQKYKINANSTISPSITFSIVKMMITQVPKPVETISDISQQAISIRRSFVKMIEIFISKDVEFLNAEDFGDFIRYIGEIGCNIIEGSTVKVAIMILSKLIEKLGPGHAYSNDIISVGYQVSCSLLRSNLNVKSPETSQISGEIAKLHLVIMNFMKATQKEELFIQNLRTTINQLRSDEYIELLNNCYILQNSQENERKTAFNQSQQSMKMIITGEIETNQILAKSSS